MAGKKRDESWERALLLAVDSEGAAAEARIAFEERREDLVAELVARSTDPRISHTRGAGVGVTRGRTARRSTYLGDATPDDVERLVNAVRGAPSPPRLRALEGDPVATTSWLRPKEAAACVRRAIEVLLRLEPDAEARATCVVFEQRVRVARPGFALATDRRRGWRLRVEARVRRGGRIAEATVETARRAEAEDRRGIERLVEALAQRVEARLGATPASSGERSIVMAPGVGGVLAHEIVGHALEADTVLAGRSWLARPIARLAPAELVILDDPRRARAPWRTDDEGHPSRATPLVRGGRVAGRIHDARSAARTGEPPTGHGRRASYRDPVRPRMGSTFIGAGSLAPEDIVRSVDTGIYVRRMEAARVDPRSGDAYFRVTDADAIVDGALGRPLGAFLLAVNGRRALSSLRRVGHDLAFDTCVGSCHRDGQTLITSVGAPTICIGLASVCAG